MLKLVFFVALSITIVFSSQIVYGENELPLPDGKNIREWESISASLIKDERYDEAIVYIEKIIEEDPENLKALSNKAGILIHLERFDESLEISNKVLEIEPNRISVLQNKGVALKMLKQYEQSYQLFNRILEIEPENKQAAISIFRVLGLMPTVPTTDSQYTIHVQIIVRDESGNLLGVIESYNARYLPSKFFDQWWEKVERLDMITKYDDSELFQINEMTSPEDDHTAKFHWETSVQNYQDMPVTIFEVFIPMMQIDMDSELTEVQLSITKN